jgi:hypothetical protein
MQVLMVEKAELSLQEAFLGIAAALHSNPNIWMLAAKTLLFQFVFTITTLQNIIGLVIFLL